MMRVFAAGFGTEVNTFSPIFMGIENFRTTLYALPGEHDDRPTLITSPLIHARKHAAAGDFELIEGTVTWTDPGGMINRATYETIRDEILGQLRAALPIDGVALCLHGAMVADGYDDPEGDLIERIRSIVGPDAVIAAGLDPHSHLTAKRVANANILVAFKEFPHTDFVERGREVVDLMWRAMQKKIRPVMSVFDCRMIDVFPTSRQPMRDFVDRMFAIERDDPKVLSLSLIHGFMAGDVPEMGTKILAITDGAPDYGAALAERLGREVFEMRGKVAPPQLSPEAAIAAAHAVGRGPVVIADMWDNPGGGVAGDSTVLLRALIAAGVRDAAIATIWDPMAVTHCFVAGEGAVVPLRFGGKSAPNCGEPFDATVKVKTLVRKAQQTFGTMSVAMGDCAVIEVEGIEVVLNSERSQAFERTVFSAVGIDPLQKAILVVKSTNHFYADFAKIAAEVIYCEAGRPYPNRPAETPYKKAPRNIWPIVGNPFAD
jgi:microcystin degradation protein MlrC